MLPGGGKGFCVLNPRGENVYKGAQCTNKLGCNKTGHLQVRKAKNGNRKR
jgi:hypothetical protein